MAFLLMSLRIIFCTVDLVVGGRSCTSYNVSSGMLT